MRLFVAVWLPDRARRALRDLPRPEHPGLRWTPEERWHVTLRFLSEVDQHDPVADALRPALRAQGPVRARLGGRTRRLGGVLAAYVTGLDELARGVVEATARMGRPPDRRPFAGHVTLARGRGRARVPADVAGAPLPEVAWEVGEVAVVRSETGPRPGYRTVASIPLGSAAG